VPAFKRLALQALDQVAGGDPQFGILLDGRGARRAGGL
jgi:myo-inositol catabolism protein IolC